MGTKNELPQPENKEGERDNGIRLLPEKEPRDRSKAIRAAQSIVFLQR
jgi:hypothetical protein